MIKSSSYYSILSQKDLKKSIIVLKFVQLQGLTETHQRLMVIPPDSDSIYIGNCGEKLRGKVGFD